MIRNRKTSPATIRDVAQHAGVAPGTVSRVLNNRMGRMTVTEATRQRILEAARVLHYMPNIHAKRLFSRRAGVIAFVLPEAIRAAESRLDMHIFGIICGAEEELSLGDCHLQLITDNQRFRDRGEHLSLFHENAIDGMLVWGAVPEASGHWRETEEQGFPVLFLGNRPAACADAVLFGHDYRTASARMAAKLLAAGRRRLLKVGGRPESDIARATIDGVRDAMAGFPDAELEILWSEYLPQAAMAQFRNRQAEGLPEGAAILAANLSIAREIRLHLRECGVPESTVVVSLDGSEFEGSSAIDTLVVHDGELGRRATLALLEYIRTRRKPADDLLPVSLSNP